MLKRCAMRITDDPAGLELRDGNGRWLATFTEGARTVRLRGPERTLREGSAAVTHETWVRCLGRPFGWSLDFGWLEAALEANEKNAPDLLALAMEYVRRDRCLSENGLAVAGEAEFGPVLCGVRHGGADFNDYLGIPWFYPGDPRRTDPGKDRYGCLDSTGFMRMIWGFRVHLPHPGPLGAVPLARAAKPDHLPRRAVQMAAFGPGVRIEGGDETPDLSRIAEGDLLFFKVAPDGPEALDHVGMYMGRDAGGRYRFISSRADSNGPTLRDTKGPSGAPIDSVLDGDGTYAHALRSARRL
jgi:hypothetical protein